MHCKHDITYIVSICADVESRGRGRAKASRLPQRGRHSARCWGHRLQRQKLEQLVWYTQQHVSDTENVVSCQGVTSAQQHTSEGPG